MGKSLNHYASRIAHDVGRPTDQALKERAKDMIKDYYAKYIIQSIDRNGISNYYILPLTLNLVPIEEHAIYDPRYDIWGHIGLDGVWVRHPSDDTNLNKVKHPLYKTYIDYVTETVIPKPMNIKNDSTFTRVSIPDTAKVFREVNEIGYWMSPISSPTRNSRIYNYRENKIYCKRIATYQKTIDRTPITQIEVEGIWESPEEVIGFYLRDDHQDYPLPFPAEMMQSIVQEILQTEFRILPADIEVPKDNIQGMQQVQSNR